MSVPAGVTFKRYTANGIATVYSIPFLIVDASDLLIILNGAPVTSGFTLSGVGNAPSSCTFASAPTGDLLFQLNMTYQRTSDFQDNGDFLADDVNLEYDRLWLAVKQLSGGNARSLTVSTLEPEGIPSIPLIASRANKIMAFDSSGNPIASNLTLSQLEEQPTGAAASASAAAASAAAAAASAASASSSEASSSASVALAQQWAAAAPGVVVSGGLYSARHYAAQAAAASQWATQPIGVPIPVWSHITGVSAPPTNDSSYRYIKLTASDIYNSGVLVSESVTGSSPLILATAVISDSGSPLNGQTIRLINTERRFIRAGSTGTAQDDALQGHKHRTVIGDASASPSTGQDGVEATQTNPTISGAGTGNYYRYLTGGASISDGTNGTPRISNETRPRNIGAEYYMRIR